MAIALVQTQSKAYEDSRTSVAVPDTGSFSCATGNTLVVGVIYFYTSGATLSGVSDVPGNTFTERESLHADNWDLRIFTAVNITGHASNVVTVAWSDGTNSYPKVFVRELSGVDAYDSGFTGTGAQSSSSPISSTSDSTSVADEWLIGLFHNPFATTTWGTSGGSANLATLSGPSTGDAAFATQLVSSAGAATIALTKTGSETAKVIAIALQPTGGGGGGGSTSGNLLLLGCG